MIGEINKILRNIQQTPVAIPIPILTESFIGSRFWFLVYYKDNVAKWFKGTIIHSIDGMLFVDLDDKREKHLWRQISKYLQIPLNSFSVGFIQPLEIIVPRNCCINFISDVTKVTEFSIIPESELFENLNNSPHVTKSDTYINNQKDYINYINHDTIDLFNKENITFVNGRKMWLNFICLTE